MGMGLLAGLGLMLYLYAQALCVRGSEDAKALRKIRREDTHGFCLFGFLNFLDTCVFKVRIWPEKLSRQPTQWVYVYPISL